MIKLKKPEISCIIITLNEEKYLPRLLESIKKQTFRNFEIIVSDNFSKDNTRKIARSYGCKIVNGGNFSEGRNKGAKIASGKYLLFLDADSEIPKDFLKINLRTFKKSKNGTGAVEGKPLSKILFDKMIFKIGYYYFRVGSIFSPMGVGCGIFSKKETFDLVGGFDKNVIFSENFDFYRRAFKYGFVYLPIPMYTSVRRLNKEGRLKFVIKYLYAGIYRSLLGEIKKPIFKYNNVRI
ncbi:glycosyltransferase [Candidatus Pacearchaeota archaeon]|nr:glycosyltransferase [Candidatus Pacearchaeota archaeon]